MIESRDIIHNTVPCPLFQDQGKTSDELTFVNQSDISSFKILAGTSGCVIVAMIPSLKIRRN